MIIQVPVLFSFWLIKLEVCLVSVTGQKNPDVPVVVKNKNNFLNKIKIGVTKQRNTTTKVQAGL